VNEDLRRHDLRDEERERLAPLLPGHPRQGHRCNDDLTVIQGILFRARASCPGRDLPGEYRNWKTVCGRHRRWSLDGTWAKILDQRRVARGPSRSHGTEAEV
jgi:transposase